MNNKIDFRNDERLAIIAYLEAKEARVKAEKAEKEAKAAIRTLFERLEKAFKKTDKSTYIYGTIQSQGRAKAIVYRETVAKGAVDWQAYAMALGGTLEGAEAYRKPDNVRTAFDWATKTQQAEIDG